MSKEKRFGSKLLHDYSRFEQTESHVPSLHLTSSFNYSSTQESIEVFESRVSGHVYTRYGNPNVASIARKIADLEVHHSDIQADALFTTNGMSAIYTLLAGSLEKGDAVLTQGDLYGGTTELLQKVCTSQGMEILEDDFEDLDQLHKMLSSSPKVKVIYLETPTNPTCRCVDIQGIAQVGHEHGALIVVDNTFCSPYLQQPLLLGADFVIHSTTKYLNGHGTGLGGAIVGSQDQEAWHRIKEIMKLIGSTGTPMDAWLVQLGLKTLKLRMDQQCSNAEQLALFLDNHPSVERVFYPGLSSHPTHKVAQKQMKKFGAMLSFDVGSRDKAIRVMDGLEMATLAPTLGDVDTLILHPDSSSHLRVAESIKRKYDITEGLIRVSVGIEDLDDLIYDFAQALDNLGE